MKIKPTRDELANWRCALLLAGGGRVAMAAQRLRRDGVGRREVGGD
jgi:hypothetical protein